MCCKHTHLLIGCCFCSVNPTESMVGPCLWSLSAWYYYGYIEDITLIITIITQCHAY